MHQHSKDNRFLIGGLFLFYIRHKLITLHFEHKIEKEPPFETTCFVDGALGPTSVNVQDKLIVSNFIKKKEGTSLN